MQVLHGHISPETAFIVEDYPYGFRLRCKMRCWIEKAEKGKGKGQYRFCTQTTNPRIEGKEVWNKPKYGVYSDFMLMYLDENNHIKHDVMNISSNPAKFQDFINKYAEQLTDNESKELNTLMKVAAKIDAIWAKYLKEYEEKKAGQLV